MKHPSFDLFYKEVKNEEKYLPGTPQKGIQRRQNAARERQKQ